MDSTKFIIVKTLFSSQHESTTCDGYVITFEEELCSVQRSRKPIDVVRLSEFESTICSRFTEAVYGSMRFVAENCHRKMNHRKEYSIRFV